jgi:two-component system phosphate regulon sensor histidine kinase PhoR
VGGNRLVWRIYPAFLLITAAALLAVGGFASGWMRDFYFERVAEGLESRARLLEPQVRRLLEAGDFAALDALCKDLGPASRTRITVVLPLGRVVADSDEDVTTMEDHSRRPEILEARTAGTGSSTRWSDTLRKNMMYVAVRLRNGDETLAFLRASVPVSDLRQLMRHLYGQLALGGLVVAVLAAVVGFGVYRRIVGPLDEIRRGVDRFARGELTTRIAVPRSKEAAGLAQAVNQMAEQLDDRLNTVLRQRNELDAVLASMVEGVLAVDAEERVLSINRAAARMLGVSGASARGRTIQEVLRNPELQDFVGRALEADAPIEGEAVLREAAGERFLQAHGSVLRDAQGERIGALIVLNDVTRLRRLENVRRDFVANVSHELRTPITSIKGSVETLLDGAIENRRDTQKFLAVVAKHADRLESIIDDLLLLSRIEQEAERADLQTEPALVRDILAEAVDACALKAADKQITVETDCPEPLRIEANAPLLTQALINLIDNAVKYSPHGATVRVEASSEGETVTIAVHDRGCGIPEVHLARLGERFYRVDRARSRRQGGTGLGLAIVKHILEAHGGRFSVESVVGEGSTFRVHLPADLADA